MHAFMRARTHSRRRTLAAVHVRDATHISTCPFIPPDDDHAYIRQPSNSTICWISIIICPKHNCAVNHQATSLNPSFQLTISVTQNLNYQHHHHPHHRQCMDRQGSQMLHLALARFYDVSCHSPVSLAEFTRPLLLQKYNLNLKHKLHTHPTNLELSPSHVALYSRRLTEACDAH